jgi:hypothetical protein
MEIPPSKSRLCAISDARLRLGDSAFFACRSERPRTARAERAALSSTLSGIIARHAALWAARNRPDGQLDSVRRLTRLLDALT